MEVQHTQTNPVPLLGLHMPFSLYRCRVRRMYLPPLTAHHPNSYRLFLCVPALTCIIWDDDEKAGTVKERDIGMERRRKGERKSCTYGTTDLLWHWSIRFHLENICLAYKMDDSLIRLGWANPIGVELILNVAHFGRSTVLAKKTKTIMQKQCQEGFQGFIPDQKINLWIKITHNKPLMYLCLCMPILWFIY